MHGTTIARGLCLVLLLPSAPSTVAIRAQDAGGVPTARAATPADLARAEALLEEDRYLSRAFFLSYSPLLPEDTREDIRRRVLPPLPARVAVRRR